MAPTDPPSPRRGRRTRSGALVVCLPGLEGVVAGELAALGIRGRPAGPGALAVQVTSRELYLANVALASATRMLVDVGELTARSFATLEERLGDVDLSPWIAPGQAVRLRITSRRSRLVHTGALEERIRRVLALAPAASDDATAALVVVRGDHDRFTFRVDSSGAPLHQRGWRGPAGKAPLRETVAAAALASVGWQPGQGLVDPFCGSGTIPIEAARIAAGIAPGAGRSFAFERWPSFAPGTLASVRAATRAHDASLAGPTLVGSDRDRGAIAAATDNASAAGVGDRVAFVPRSVSDLRAPDGAAPGWVLSNPPWGRRLQGGDLRDLYARLGQVLARELDGWGVGLLVADLGLARAAGVHDEVLWTVRAGAVPVHLVVRHPPSSPVRAVR